MHNYFTLLIAVQPLVKPYVNSSRRIIPEYFIVLLMSRDGFHCWRRFANRLTLYQITFAINRKIRGREVKFQSGLELALVRTELKELGFHATIDTGIVLQKTLETLTMYFWWSFCTVYLLACQVRVSVGESDLCRCVCVTSFER